MAGAHKFMAIGALPRDSLSTKSPLGMSLLCGADDGQYLIFKVFRHSDLVVGGAGGRRKIPDHNAEGLSLRLRSADARILHRDTGPPAGSPPRRPASSLPASASARSASYTPYDLAGLSAAIRLSKSEIGAHLLSGTVIELSALDALLLEWRMAYPDHALVQPATSSGMRLLTQEYWILFLHPPQTNNRGNSIASLSCVTAWLGGNTEEMGVEVYPGFAGAQLLLSPSPKA
ncbi:hypothetical protein K438DRAFT_1773262 [Mycena galopus ATCC 62051]|nr:hypothetical protein K438DRAFT_1773262 [Mycena galopus ATCC 62051]